MYSVRRTSLLIIAFVGPLFIISCSIVPKPPLNAITPDHPNLTRTGLDPDRGPFLQALAEREESKLLTHVRREARRYTAAQPRTLDLCPSSVKGSDIATTPEYDWLRSFFRVECLPPPTN